MSYGQGSMDFGRVAGSVVCSRTSYSREVDDDERPTDERRQETDADACAAVCGMTPSTRISVRDTKCPGM